MQSNKPRPMRTIGHTLSPEEKARLQEIAIRESRSLAGQITYMVRRQLEIMDKQEGTTAH